VTATHGGQHPYINIAPDRSVTITEKPTWGAQVHGVQQAINKLTPSSSGPKPQSTAFWNQGKVGGEVQVAAKEPQRAAPDYSRHPQLDEHPRPRSEPRPQVADAGPKAGSSAYWRGPERPLQNDPAQAPDESARIASARRSRGHSTGEADVDPNIPYEGSAVSPGSAVAAAPSESSTEYAGGG
jgi:hypothetical protein